MVISPTHHNATLGFPDAVNQATVGQSEIRRQVQYTVNFSPNPHQQHATSLSEKKLSSKPQQKLQIKLETLENPNVQNEPSLNTFEGENSLSQLSEELQKKNNKSIFQFSAKMSNRPPEQSEGMLLQES